MRGRRAGTGGVVRHPDRRAKQPVRDPRQPDRFDRRPPGTGGPDRGDRRHPGAGDPAGGPCLRRRRGHVQRAVEPGRGRRAGG
ncbi:hypothetical protein G6F22_020735 [Rhizopus arrhizus]|nr:hypothetical protein G6F22_020735 [Rhizopus arrhizus]